MNTICLQPWQIINKEYYQAISMILDYLNRFYGHDTMCIDSES